MCRFYIMLKINTEDHHSSQTSIGSNTEQLGTSCLRSIFSIITCLDHYKRQGISRFGQYILRYVCVCLEKQLRSFHDTGIKKKNIYPLREMHFEIRRLFRKNNTTFKILYLKLKKIGLYLIGNV